MADETRHPPEPQPGVAPAFPAAMAEAEGAAARPDAMHGANGRRPPRERLDPRARTVWRLSAALWAVVLLASLGGTAWLLERWDVSLPLLALGWVAVAAVVTLGVVIGPGVLYRHWRYELREEEIDLQHGLITLTRTLIPMPRIQHVDTQRGPIERAFGLASVVLYTAAGASTIPGLASETADGLRDRIAALAGVRDDL